MAFDAFRASEHIRRDYVDFLLDRAFGRFPGAGTEECWRACREQMRLLWTDGDPGRGVTPLFAEPLAEPLFPFARPDSPATLDTLQAGNGQGPTDARPLHPRLVELLQQTEMGGWDFMSHQVEAFAKTVVPPNGKGPGEGQSIVVSSGTSSGKTECFLIPMLNRMFWLEGENGLSRPGVRILIVYPMNALVNNQLKRLRRLLSFPAAQRLKIAFGAYTGKTEEQVTETQLNGMPPGELRDMYQMANFRRDRTGIRSNPPHILVTNYSMLEYMLLRPKDQPIFPGDGADRAALQTIVLDEAHTYAGSLGNDIALLLRRVALRFGTSMEQVLGIATSATLASNDQQERLRDIGVGLFSKQQGQVAVITGSRVLPPLGVAPQVATPLDPYAVSEQEWQALCDLDAQEPEGRLRKMAEEPQLPGVLSRLGLNETGVDPAPDEPVSEFLHRLFAMHQVTAGVREAAFDAGGPLALTELMRGLNLEPYVNYEHRAAEALLQLMSKARPSPDKPVFLPTKLHVYVRTPPQTYSDLFVDGVNPLGHLFGVPETPTGQPLLFPAYCAGKQRREAYFTGRLHHQVNVFEAVDRLLLYPQAARVQGAVPVVFRLATPDDPSPAVFGLVITDDGLREVESNDQGGFVLATGYGSEEVMTCEQFLNTPAADRAFKTTDGVTIRLEGSESDEEDEEDEVDPNRSRSNLRPLGQSGRDLADVILFEALLPHLPAKRRTDGTAVGGGDNDANGARKRDTAAAGRGSIIFADTRQGAAWRAAYVQNSHTRDVVRRCIYRHAADNAQALAGAVVLPPVDLLQMTPQQFQEWQQAAAAAAQNPAAPVYVVVISDIWTELATNPTFRREITLRSGLQNRLFPQGLADQADAQSWSMAARALVAAELLIPLSTGRNLEAMGLLRSYYSPDQFPQLPGAHDPILDGFTPVQRDFLGELAGDDRFCRAWLPLLAQIVDYMRRRGSVRVPWVETPWADPLSVEPLGRTQWSFNRWYVFDGVNEDATRERRRNFAGIRGNIRNYTRRLLEYLGYGEDNVDARASWLLQLVFRLLLRRAQQGGTLLTRRVGDQNQEQLAINGEMLQFQVCPAALQIAVEHPRLLTRLSRDQDPVISTDHRARVMDVFSPLNTGQDQAYKRSRDFRTFTEGQPMGIRAMEHTAQIHSTELAQVEERFLKGELNLLSCSTTMELGIDIGDLVSVLLGNLPPESANYIQRAGRAGRRNEGTALVLAVLRDNPYDLSVFRDSRFMYDRPMRMAPVDLLDERQVRRHVHSFLLTSFFRSAGIEQNSPLFAWADCETFFGTQARLDSHALDVGKPAPQLAVLDGWGPSLTCLCDLIRQRLLAGTEGLAPLLTGTCLEDADPVEIRQALVDRLRELQEEYETAYWNLRSQWNAANGAPATQAAIGMQARQLKRENLVGFLARAGVIPRYGFPIDVIPLITRNRADEGNAYWERAEDEYRQNNRTVGDLKRSMDLALAEYAPGARVVVNQQVYTSQGMTLNCYDPEQGPFERFFFIVCRRCGHFQTGRDVPQRCDACAHETNWQGWAAQGATAPVIPGDELGETAMQAALVVAASAAVGETLEDAVTPPPSIVRSYIKPRAFSVAYSRRPVATAYHETRPYTASSRCVSINTAEESLVRLGGGQTAVSFKFVPDQEILYFNAGMSPRRAGNTAIHGYGYRVCLACGYAEPEEGYGKPPSPEMLDHDKLTEGDQCTGPRRAWANVILGAEARTDVLIFRLPTAVLDGDWATSPDVLVTTFMTALRMAAARILEVDNRFIGGQVQRVRLESGNLEAIDILLFDAGAGDTGYMSRLRDQPLDVIEEAIGYLDCPDAAEDDGGGLCTTCCHRCLLSYDSAWYAQRGLLDRRATRAWVDARRADMLGTGQIIDGQPVGRAFDVVHSLRFGSGIVRLFLPFFTGEGLESSEHLLRRLFEVTIRRAGCRVSVLLPRTSIDNMGQESGYRARSQLWQWQQNSPQFQIRTVVQDAISGYSHFRLAVNGREFFLDDFDATVDFAAPGSRQVSWFAAKEGDGGCQAFDTLWGKAEAVPQPKLPETTVRLDIPNGTDATAPNSLYQKLASHPQIQLGNLLAGRQVVRLTYQDRYLRSPHAWRNLISLMRQLPMSPNCDILALTVQQDSSGEERWRPDVGNASDVGRIVVHVHADFAEREMGYVMDYLAAQCGLQRDRCRLGMLSREVRGRYTYSVQQGRQIWTPGWLGDEHARKMLCILDDGSGFSLMFDQGMDWACPRESYRFDTVRPGPGSPLNPSLFDGARPYLTRLSYAVFRRELTPSEKGLWDLCGALTSNQCRWC